MSAPHALWQHNCECGAMIRLCGFDTDFDQRLLDAWNARHYGTGHERVSAWEANQVRHYRHWERKLKR